MQLNNHQISQLHDEFMVKDQYSVVTQPLTMDIDCLYEAAKLNTSPVIYFAKPKQIIEYLAIGGHQVMDNYEARKYLKKNINLRCFGINSFGDESADFPSEYWVLPILWFEKKASNWSINLVVESEIKSRLIAWQKVEAIINEINHSKPHIIEQYYQEVSHFPEKKDWVNSVKKAKSLILKNDIQKIVLARQSTFTFSQPINPFLLLKKVQEMDNGVYNFCIKLSDDKSFIGGTPERLFEINDHCLESDAIAGTLFKPDGSNVDELKESLLNSEKNIGEHQYVVDFIQEKFHSLCESWVADQERSLIELKYLLHLIMHFRGKLKKNMDWLSVIHAMHPTPAVAGVPAEKVLQLIIEMEPFNRGWYAGPMGVISCQDAHIVVAIRSGAVFNDKVVLDAGAGIVADSNPSDEWDELNAKINLFATIFKEGNL